jgi:hypothetical protein
MFDQSIYNYNAKPFGQSTKFGSGAQISPRDHFELELGIWVVWQKTGKQNRLAIKLSSDSFRFIISHIIISH